MNLTDRSTIDMWSEFAYAVQFVESVERSGLTLWDALTEALVGWLDEDRRARALGQRKCDQLRNVLRQIVEETPEVGAPGGVCVGAILDAAMSDWVDAAALRLNDGHPFVR